MIELARKNAKAISAGHSFIVFLGPGFYPVNVLNTIKMVPEVCQYSAPQPTLQRSFSQKRNLGRGVMGVVDGFAIKGVEDEAEINLRKDLLRKIGYKLKADAGSEL